ncbi:MAG TPA: LPS export ABC transporter periplasmic protein LptC [Longimicrobium sp.]|nr:LPS export ABC transporter periplasmic protein LptC [Longimicrobium sp.]
MGATVAACGGQPAPAASAGNLDADATQRTYGMNLKLTEGGVIKADLHADTAIQRPGTTTTEIRGVRLKFYGQGGGQPGDLTSRSGEYDARSGMMIARGNVVLITQGENGKRVIKSEELHYDQKGDRVWSTRETRVEEPGRTWITQGFTSDTRFTNLQGRNARTVGSIRVNSGAGDL